MSPERITKAQRWLDLIACLLGRRRPVTVAQIFDAVPAYRIDTESPDGPDEASVRRKFERDKDELRELGIPIDTVEHRVGYGLDVEVGYRLRSGAFYMPYVRIVEEAAGAPDTPGKPDETGAASASPRGARVEAAQPEFTREELRIVLEALGEAAEIPGSPLAGATRSAYRKLTFDLDALPEEPTLIRVRPPGGEELGDALQRIDDALRRRKRIRFEYHGLARGETTERDVAPFGLLMENGAWYLVGHDALRDDVRVFRVGRMESPTVNPRVPATPDFQIPDGFSLADYRNRDAWRMHGAPEAIDVRVRFVHPMSLWAERNGFGELDSEGPDGATVRRFEVGHVRPFLRWILGLRGEATILDPPELKGTLRELAANIGAAHE